MQNVAAATRSQRREAARAARRAREAAERRAARLRRAYRQLAALAAASCALVLAMIAVGNATRPQHAPADAATATASASRLDGIPQSGISLGAPSAPLTVVEFADMQCPFCARFDRDELPAIVDRYVRSGQVRLQLRVLAFLGDDSVKAARAAADAAARNRLWQFADAFFQRQGEENSGYVTDAFLRSIDPAVIGADAAAGDAAIAAARAAAERHAIASTPSFVVAGKVVQASELQAAIEARLAR